MDISFTLDSASLRLDSVSMREKNHLPNKTAFSVGCDSPRFSIRESRIACPQNCQNRIQLSVVSTGTSAIIDKLD